MVDMPSTNDAAEKFTRRGAQASEDFRQGVEGSSTADWQEGASNAEQNWEQGVQEAAANNAFARGVRDPSADWQQRALELGTQRFGPGIQASGDKYADSVQPFFDALGQLSLPARGPRGSQQNFDRSRRVGQRLNELRQQR